MQLRDIKAHCREVFQSSPADEKCEMKDAIFF